MPVLTPRRQSAPVLWDCFCKEWLQLSPTHTAQWWQALTRARWSRATTLRSTVLGQTVLAQDWAQVLTLYEATMAPAALIAVLEDLGKEGCVSRWQTRRLEDAILAQTDQGGHWKGAR